jgi:hypothetical protein
MGDFESGCILYRKMGALIGEEHTGPPKEFADKLHITERTLYVYLERYGQMLAPHGITIVYSRILKTYHYSMPGTFEIKFIWVFRDGKISDPGSSVLPCI